MKKYNISLILLLIIGFIFSSCENELDIEKMGNLGAEEDFYKTDDDAEEAITCCYLDMGTLFEEIMSTSNLLSDDILCGGAQKNDNSQREDLGAYTFGTTNENIESLFSDLYTMIYHANLVIEKFDSYDTAIKKRSLAEAYFFRGFAHFYLGACFGTAPLVDHLLSTEEYAQPNSTKEKLFEQASNDLKTAVESGNLESKTDVNTNIVRISQEAAKAYLGKTYVFMEEWAKAVTILDEVIASGKYKLYEGDYENMLHASNDYCSENILERNSVSDYSNLWGNYDMYFIYHGYRGELYNWSLTSEYNDLSSNGYGFYNPTKSLYDAFVSEEGVDGYRLNQSIKTYDQLKSVGITILSGKILHGHEGYWNWKNRLLSEDYIVYGSFSTVNARYIRYAEVLLLAAEANLQNGNQDKAWEYLNQVRDRAKVVLIPNSTTVTLDDIKLEKRLELYDEGCRWMDLVRWGDAATVLANKGNIMSGYNGDTDTIVDEYTTTSQGFVVNKNEVLPIPDKELTLNSNLVQNAGW